MLPCRPKRGLSLVSCRYKLSQWNAFVVPCHEQACRHQLIKSSNCSHSKVVGRNHIFSLYLNWYKPQYKISVIIIHICLKSDIRKLFIILVFALEFSTFSLVESEDLVPLWMYTYFVKNAHDVFNLWLLSLFWGDNEFYSINLGGAEFVMKCVQCRLVITYKGYLNFFTFLPRHGNCSYGQLTEHNVLLHSANI